MPITSADDVTAWILMGGLVIILVHLIISNIYESKIIKEVARRHGIGADCTATVGDMNKLANKHAATPAPSATPTISELADEVNQCLQIILINAGNLENGGLVSKERGAIEDAVDRAAKATWAALRGDSNGKP